MINSKTGEPLFYEMDGYDSLLGSHYDKYYIEYYNFKDNDDIPASVFDIPKSSLFTYFRLKSILISVTLKA